MVMNKSFFWLIAFLICSLPTDAQDTSRSPAEVMDKPWLLSLDALFKDKHFDTERVPEFRWNAKGTKYYTIEKGEPGNLPSIASYDPDSQAKTIVADSAALTPPGAKAPLTIDAIHISEDEKRLLIYTNSQKVWRQNTRGDYWVFDVANRTLKPVGGSVPPASLMFAKFSPDASRVAYVFANNLYVQDVNTLQIQQLTSDGSPTCINGTADWVNEEELNLRDCYRWSSDGKRVLFWQFDTMGVRNFHLINNTDSLTPKIQTFAYPKVGEMNSATRLGVKTLEGGEVVWLQIPGDPREHYFPHAEWTPDGSQILAQQFNRLQSELTLWLVDPQSGSARKLMRETDDAWLENENPVRWIREGKDFLWLSEHTGWRHAYIAHLDGSPLTPITRGEFDVMEIEAIDEAGGWLYYAASPENATQRNLYRISLDGSFSERLSSTEQLGWHKLEIAPKAKWGVHSFSSFTSPPVVDLVRLPSFTKSRRLVDNQVLRSRLEVLAKPEIEFFKVALGDGTQLDGWSLKPPRQLVKADRLPLVMHVYGEPHGQTVRDAWPGTRGLWHWYLSQRGMMVASVDNRGTNVPKGRIWRKSVHRKIGITAPEEQAFAVRTLLTQWPFVDPHRVGIWGWSGGGSMSLHAIFRYPELYRTAVSVAPVADQRLYDTIYQERYMGLPQDNPEGFRDGSPLTYAKNLQGNLLLIHGTGDDNCHYQGTERLMNELIASGKHFSILPYPNRAHGVNEGNNTVRHFWGEIALFLETHLQPSP